MNQVTVDCDDLQALRSLLAFIYLASIGLLRNNFIIGLFKRSL